MQYIENRKKDQNLIRRKVKRNFLKNCTLGILIYIQEQKKDIEQYIKNNFNEDVQQKINVEKLLKKYKPNKLVISNLKKFQQLFFGNKTLRQALYLEFIENTQQSSIYSFLRLHFGDQCKQFQNDSILEIFREDKTHLDNARQLLEIKEKIQQLQDEDYDYHQTGYRFQQNYFQFNHYPQTQTQSNMFQTIIIIQNPVNKQHSSHGINNTIFNQKQSFPEIKRQNSLQCSRSTYHTQITNNNENIDDDNENQFKQLLESQPSDDKNNQYNQYNQSQQQYQKQQEEVLQQQKFNMYKSPFNQIENTPNVQTSQLESEEINTNTMNKVFNVNTNQDTGQKQQIELLRYEKKVLRVFAYRFIRRELFQYLLGQSRIKQFEYFMPLRYNIMEMLGNIQK